MARFFTFILVFIVVNSFVMIEEESLVMIASIVWLDAAGGVIREALTSELEGRGDKIKETFFWYLNAKKSLINLLIKKHKERAELANTIETLYVFYIERLLNSVLESYTKNALIIANQERKNDVIETGLVLVNDLSRKEMQLILGAQYEPISTWVDKSVKGGLLIK